MGIRQITKTKRTVLTSENYCSGINNYNFGCFAGVVYYQKKVEPEKELLKEMNYGVSSMKDYFSNYISLGNYKD